MPKPILFLFALVAASRALAAPASAAAAPPATAPTAAAAVEVPLLRHAWTPAELSAVCEKAEVDTDAALKAMVDIADDKRTFADSFEAFDRITGGYSETIARVLFMKEVHKDAAVRDAGAACEERSGKYGVALSARKDLYMAMKGYLDHAGKAAHPDAQQQRLIELTMLDFKKSGLALSGKDRAKLVEVRSRIAELQSRYSKALSEDTSHFEVKRAELEGLPEDFISGHADPKNKDIFILTVKYPDYYPVMENAKREALRKKMEIAFMNRGGKGNVKLLDEALVLRAQAAHLLGYKNHVDEVVEDRMAKSSATIDGFLARMKTGLRPGLIEQTHQMVMLKAAETKKAEKVTKINAWDWRYYLNQIKQRDYAIDDEKVRAYFPADKVLAGMFQIYSTLFGITLNEVKGADVWADGVSLYQIKDKESGNALARFYLDLYPREGKYGHAAEFTIAAGHNVGSAYRNPLACLVVNFQPPHNGQPAHLSMDEVDTLFHEFGHVMHETLTTSRYASQAGTRTALDFVEAPSQMLENWAFAPEVLALISVDPTDATKPLPPELATRLNAARKYDAAVKYSRQVFLGTFDLKIHTKDKVSSDAVAREVWADIMNFPEDKAEHFAGTFGHMMGGYDGGYYGYLWSEVFAADMFTRFQSEGVLNPKTGRAYRDLVISRGRTVEANVLLHDFLGRAPNEAAFLKMIGIAPLAPAPVK